MNMEFTRNIIQKLHITKKYSCIVHARARYCNADSVKRIPEKPLGQQKYINDKFIIKKILFYPFDLIRYTFSCKMVLKLYYYTNHKITKKICIFNTIICGLLGKWPLSMRPSKEKRSPLLSYTIPSEWVVAPSRGRRGYVAVYTLAGSSRCMLDNSEDLPSFVVYIFLVFCHFYFHFL